jgi:hypothetical protein
MANSAYTSGINTDALFVPAKAATVFAAHESSLFLGGQLIPVVNAPNGVLQVPELAAVSATKISAEAAPGVDLDTVLSADTKNTIVANLYAARSVVRDLGNVDPQEIGRVLGNSVSASFDADVATVLATLTSGTTGGSTVLDDIFGAVGDIRGNGETGNLYGVVSADLYGTVMSAVGSTAYAGGDMFQGAALRSGLLGAIAGVPMFVSSYLSEGVAVFGQDAMRIGMQKNIDLEVGRRPEAVGFDVVASLHAAVGLIDASRGVYLDYSA